MLFRFPTLNSNISATLGSTARPSCTLDIIHAPTYIYTLSHTRTHTRTHTNQRLRYPERNLFLLITHDARTHTPTYIMLTCSKCSSFF
eukprot:m.852943 g.852943  ORF g.852943 m.852943 type:complete len:88 (-) comp23497_c0_seq3:110-373(-)